MRETIQILLGHYLGDACGSGNPFINRRLICLLLFPALPLALAAQRTHDLKANIFYAHTERVTVYYEWSPHPKWSMEGGVGYDWEYFREWTPGTIDRPGEEFKFKQRRFMLEAGVRHYPLGSSHKPARRFFVGAHFVYSRETFRADNYDAFAYQRYGYRPDPADRQNYGPGLLLGYKWLIKKRVAVELWSGYFLDMAAPETSPGPRIDILAALNVGYRFPVKNENQ